MNPFISIIVPVYNVEKYLEDCLDSLLNQSYRDFEVICINDGSTDNSGKILERYAKQDKRIVVIAQGNQGQSGARNTGLDKARGEYICFVDSDDMLVPNALQILVNAVFDDDVDIVGYDTAPLLYESEELKIKENKDAYYLVKNVYPGIRAGRQFFVEMMENKEFVDSVWLAMIRKQWLEDKGIRFCKGMVYEDSVFIMQCYFLCERMKHIKEQLYIYRVRRNSTMTETYIFKHELSRIWQFSECLRIIYTLAETEQEIRALTAFADMSMINAKRIDYALEEKEKMQEMNALHSLLAKAMGLGKMHYNTELSLEGLLTMIRKYSHVILYGAGLIGSKMQKYIQIKGMRDKMLGFAVSDKCKPILKEGVYVRCIRDYKADGNTVVIISARENYHSAMVNAAKKSGFHKVYVIDSAMEYLIDKELRTIQLETENR